MEIQFFRPEGPQPTEMVGLDEFRRALPRSWKGFANFVMRQPTRRGQDRELDVVIIAPDRLVIVDLKHVRGRIENRGGFWFRGEDNLGSSPAHKIRDNAKILASLIRSEVSQLPAVPPVESVVVLTNPLADPSGLDPVERDRTIKLVDFVRIANEARFRALFTTHSQVDPGQPLTAAPAVTALQKFFRNGRLFEPRKTQFHGFVPTGDPEFAHRLYVEYPCHQAADPNYTGLLRLWDFSAEPDFLVEAERRPIADRERAVLGHIRIQDPALYQNYVLQSVRHDPEYTLRYSEVFDRLPDLERLTRFSAVLTDLTLERRVEFAALFLDRVASLHRIRIAHRDLDRHSVWIDERRSKVVLSSFGAAHFPERRSIGDTRSKLMASGLRVPEDVGESARGTPFQQDVFLCGALIWNLLTGQRLESIDKVPIWGTDTFGKAAEVPAVFASWFDKCLHLEAKARFTDAIEAADAFARLVRQTEKVSLEKQLERYRQDVDPISDFPPIDWITQKPYRVYRARRNGTDFFVKSWPERSLGERRKTAARQIEFLGKADTLRISAADWLPKIELACLCTDGLLLVEEWIEGLTLEKCNTAEWPSVDLRDFVRDLVGAVDDLHELGLVHGDLSPGNIMMRSGEPRPRPVLVDAVDFTTDEGGKKTPAYCPPDDSDLRVRDRFAVSQIVVELADRCPDDEMKAILLAGAAKCGEGATAWLTLKPLKDAVAPRKAQPPAPTFTLTIGTPRPAFEGSVLADNGLFHLVKSRDRCAVEIFGFDQKITIDFDDKDYSPRYAVAHGADLRGASWAQRWRTFSFSGSVTVHKSQRLQFSGFAPLSAMLRPEPAAPKASAAEVVAATAAPPAKPEPHTQHFPVARFWEETITIEDEITPDIQLVEDPRFDADERTLLVISSEEVLAELDLSDGQVVGVSWNGRKIGDLDAARSRGTKLLIRNVRGHRGLRSGAYLKLQTSDDFTSFQRRSRAVSRILEGRSQIRSLVSYFDPHSKIAPKEIGAQIADEEIAPYGLNADQSGALKHLWKFGPVGLLQGPPGTGKTLFIASLVHYALTRARLRNVLVLSQSNEAVNTAAERILKVSGQLGGSIDLLRVGQHAKISAALRQYHARAIQDRYRELFRASMKERVALAALRLGLDRNYISEALEIEAVFGSLVRQIELCEMDIASGSDADVVAAAQERLGPLKEVWTTALSERGISEGGEPNAVLDGMRDELASRHAVYDTDARRRLLRLLRLAQEWASALATRGRSLEELLARSRNLICGTCVGIGRRGIQLDKNAFDLVIIDEAARCTPSELAVGMQSGRRIMLVGDHRQLPPLFDYDVLEALGPRLGIPSRKELQRSDFERAFHSDYGRAVAQTLKKQYRMAPKIGQLVAEVFYPGQGLETKRGPVPGYYQLLARPLDDELTWIDTGYSRGSRREGAIGTSYVNRREALAAIAILRSIAANTSFVNAARQDLKEDEHLIGVICMYAPQADLVDEMFVTSGLPDEFRSLVKIDTVDAYQGKENRIVLLSLVRSNPERAMGHVRISNRVNVALSRAMERLVIIGSAHMFGRQGNPLAEVLKVMRPQGRVFPDERLGK
jgi:serine/threonine protein kinase